MPTPVVTALGAVWFSVTPAELTHPDPPEPRILPAGQKEWVVAKEPPKVFTWPEHPPKREQSAAQYVHDTARGRY